MHVPGLQPCFDTVGVNPGHHAPILEKKTGMGKQECSTCMPERRRHARLQIDGRALFCFLGLAWLGLRCVALSRLLFPWIDAVQVRS